jgi:hypothetical protein
MKAKIETISPLGFAVTFETPEHEKVADLVTFLPQMEAALVKKGYRPTSQDESPDFRYALAEYAGFDWGKLGAVVKAQDRQGVTVVEWGGRIWQRRSGAGKFGKAVWFSRATGQDENGTLYARLVTFKDYTEPEEVPFNVE